jgi:hypothetical protein
VDWSTHPVYRYYLPGEDHMFRLDPWPAEGYAFEGEHFRLFSSDAPGRVALYQVWCAGCTDHMPTTDPVEGAPAYGQPELLGWCYPDARAEASNELRRLNSAAESNHFASTSPAEWAATQAIGYVLEGRLCFAP